jgi:crotonobetainyl-CoA:carnitine CoA-transferase CaiB-like acyl-CoA transferase
MTAGVRWTQADDLLPSRLQVAALAEASVGAAALAGAELAAVRNGGVTPGVQVDSTAVAAAFASDRALRLNGQEQVSLSPLSKFCRCADGWVRMHCNYPHHQARLLDALEVRVAPQNARTAVGEAIATSSAEEVAERVTAFGGLAVVVRTPQSWAQHEQASAIAGLPLLELRKASNAASRPLEPAPRGSLLPAAGLRILDLSRVIAGPVATRTLALLGADVLRIDRPDLPELIAQHLDTGMGKLSALLDLRKPADLEVLENLLSTADVVVTGYRPGALDRFGLDAEALRGAGPRWWSRRFPAGVGSGPGAGGGPSTAWCKPLAGSRTSRRRRTGRQEPCRSRRWITPPATFWPPQCSVHWPAARLTAADGSPNSPWLRRRPGCCVGRSPPQRLATPALTQARRQNGRSRLARCGTRCPR